MADKFADRFKTKSSRLKNFDYSTPGFYFITICTLNKNNFFGKIINYQMELSKVGTITDQCIINIPNHFLKIALDKYVVMPNHVHILFRVETLDLASLQTNSKIKVINYSHKNHPNFYSRLSQKSNQLIPKVIQQLKSSVKRKCNQQNLFFAWQPRYYDHIINNEQEFFKIKNYIINNPINWQKDKFYKK